MAMSTSTNPRAEQRADSAPVVAVLLAAGFSSRMGRRKQLLPWNGATMLSSVADCIARQARLPLVLVHQGAVPAYSGGVAVENEAPEQGLSHSLKLGLEAVAQGWPTACAAVFLADQPFVTASDIAAAVVAFRQREKGCHALRPVYNGQVGHPVLLDREAVSWAFRLEGDRGLRDLLAVSGFCTVDIEVNGRPNPAWDVDTPSDYRQACRWLSGEDRL